MTVTAIGTIITIITKTNHQQLYKHLKTKAMKYLKVLAIAIVAMFAFEGAKAQVVVNARIGSAPV